MFAKTYFPTGLRCTYYYIVILIMDIRSLFQRNDRILLLRIGSAKLINVIKLLEGSMEHGSVCIRVFTCLKTALRLLHIDDKEATTDRYLLYE